MAIKTFKHKGWTIIFRFENGEANHVDLYCARLVFVNFGSEILSSGSRMELEAISCQFARVNAVFRTQKMLMKIHKI